MTAESAIAPIGSLDTDVVKTQPTPAAAVSAINDSISADRFEISLTKAAEIPDASMRVGFSPSVGAGWGVKDAATDVATFNVAVRPLETGDSLQNQLGSYLQGFGERAANYPFDVNNAVQNQGAGSPDGSLSIAGATAAGASGDGAMTAEHALRLMQRTFQFAVEVEMVSNVSSKSTKVVNDLMKGQ